MAERTIERSDQELVRGIQPWHASLIALGGIIGSCYFLELGWTYANMGPGAVLITYAFAGLTIYGVMQSFAELLVNIPRRGSFVSYTREFMGDTASAGIGWAFWCNWVAYIPSEALATAIFVNHIIGLVGGPETEAYFNSNPAFTFLWGVLALALLTAINVYHVKWFGHLESIMAIIKIIAIALFCIVGVLIWFGVMGHGGSFTATIADLEADTAAGAIIGNYDAYRQGGELIYNAPDGFKGLDVMLNGDGSVLQKLFPGGAFVMITLMIWTLVNFQGSEIVGLAAAETQNPQVNVPLACRRVAYRIILIYLVPIFILTLIMPYWASTLESSVFAQALYAYGFKWGAGLFTVVTLIAAFSCANSGFYGTVRSMYGLSVEGMAPKFLSKLNRFNVPQNATLFTLIPIWFVFLLGFAVDILGWWGGELGLYTALVGIAGFTGTLCWVGILFSQIRFRSRLKERGYDADEVLIVKAKWYPWLAWVSIIVQIAAMILICFEEGGMDIFILSMIIIIVPIVVYLIQKKRGKIRTNIVLGADEITFDEKFPVKSA